MLELLPLIGWVLLLGVSLGCTVCVYLVLGKVLQENFAGLEGKIMGLGIKLAGPAALYVLLLVLGRVYIPAYAEITLTGTVTDVDGRPLKDYRIAAVDLLPVSADGRFAITARRTRGDDYVFFVSKGAANALIELQVTNPENVSLPDFPDGKLTKFWGGIPLDQSGEPLPAGYRLLIEHEVRPVPAIVGPKKELEVEIENGIYRAIVQDPQGRQRAMHIFSDVSQGSRVPLPSQVNLTR
jgi:hypothetical protein